jgi:hypothetical protein
MNEITVKARLGRRCQQTPQVPSQKETNGLSRFLDITVLKIGLQDYLMDSFVHAMLFRCSILSGSTASLYVVHRYVLKMRFVMVILFDGTRMYRYIAPLCAGAMLESLSPLRISYKCTDVTTSAKAIRMPTMNNRGIRDFPRCLRRLVAIILSSILPFFSR